MTKLKTLALTLATLSVVLSACIKPELFNQQIAIPNKSWSVRFIPEFRFNAPIKEDDYTLSITLRHTARFKYESVFLIVKKINPSGRSVTYSIKVPLAASDGRWLGTGAGSILTRHVAILKNVKFNERGEYRFTIMQNMSDEPLTEITDVGLKIERAE